MADGKEMTLSSKSNFKCEFCDSSFDSKSWRAALKINYHRDQVAASQKIVNPCDQVASSESRQVAASHRQSVFQNVALAESRQVAASYGQSALQKIFHLL